MSTSQTKNIAITKLKRLKVRKRKGRAILLRMGLTNEFKNPKTAPTKSKESKNWEKASWLDGKTKKWPIKNTLSKYL